MSGFLVKIRGTLPRLIAVSDKVAHGECGHIKNAHPEQGPLAHLDFRLTRDVVGQNAGEKITTFDASETNPLEKHCQLTWCVEMSYSVREVTNTFLALGRTPENHCREPYRETQIDQVR